MLDSGAVGLLDEHVAVVTGAGRGLGRAHALTLAAAGAAVLVNDLEGADDTVTAIEDAGGRAVADSSDIGGIDGATRLVDRAVEVFGRIDLVMNNAGISVPTDIVALEAEGFDRHLDVHLRATVGTTRGAFRHFREQGAGGRVVNTVSGHGLEPRNTGSSAYAAAKGAIFSFTRAAALEAAELGATVNAVSPLAYTRMSEAYLSQIAGAEERYDPAHVSRVVVFLASAFAADVNGRVLRVEGSKITEYRVELGPAIEPGSGESEWTPETLAARIEEVLS